MNQGIYGLNSQFATMPRGLLGRPTPIPTAGRQSLRGFDPRSLEGCTGWWDANNTDQLTLNGPGVSQWRNLGLAGGSYSQSTAASQPTLITIDGMRFIHFPGGAVSLIGPTVQQLGDGQKFRLYAFFVMRQTANFNAVRVWSNPSSNSASGFGFYANLSGFSFWDASEAGARVQGGAIGSSVTVARLVRDAANASYAYNSVVRSSRTTATGSLNAHGGEATVLGSLNSSSTVVVSFAEMITYNRPMLTYEIQTIERYLGEKYGIAIP